MFVTRVVAGIVAFLALLVACSEPVQPDPTPDIAATVEALVATQVAAALPPTPIPTPTPLPPTATPHPCATDVSGSYEGFARNETFDVEATITADIDQSGCALIGKVEVFPPLAGSGPIAGSISSGNLEFTIQAEAIGIEIRFAGTVDQVGILSGRYEIPELPGIAPTQVGSWQLSPVGSTTRTPAGGASRGPVVPTPTKTPTAMSSAAAPGRFIVSYVEPSRADFKVYEEVVKANGWYERASDWLTRWFALPEDINIVHGQCNVTNAFYDSETRSIVLCYELTEEIISMMWSLEESDEEWAGASDGALKFVFFHELGHALVDVLDLPITGREEDAVDQLATLILLGSGDEGMYAAINGARFFLLGSVTMSIMGVDVPFWDEHSLGMQRFYNILCWAYGEDPASRGNLIDWGLPQERASQCSGEFKQLDSAWDRLLAPHER